MHNLEQVVEKMRTVSHFPHRASGRKTRPRQSGFTLLELLVSLAVFAVMAALAYGGLGSVLDTARRVEIQAAETHAVQWAVFRLDEDLAQFLPRSIRNEWGDVQPGMQGTDSALEFTRAGNPNPLGVKRGSLLRVAYAWEDQALIRRYWTVMDRAPDSQPLTQTLLREVTSFRVRYWDEKLTFHQHWPPMNRESARLAAVEFTLELPRWGEVRRLIPVVGDQAWTETPQAAKSPGVR